MEGNDVFDGACLPGGTAAALEIKTENASAIAKMVHANLGRWGGEGVMP
jgi:hypothetical protein